MWSRLGTAVALSAGMLALAAPAYAQDPVDLGGAYVLDAAAALEGDDAARVQEALDSLYDRAGIQLFVVYVDSFTGAGEGDWANQTASMNGLGQSDILLAIAIEDRNFEVSVDDDITLSDAQLSTVETNYLIPQLRDDNWAEAAIAAADGYAIEATGVVGPTVPDPPDGNDGGTTSDEGIPILPIIGGVAVVGIGLFVYSRTRRRNAGGSVTAVPDQMTQEQLDQRAGSLLVQLDDSLKTSEQELGFAVAQFGDAATADFTATLESARAKVAQAFALRQKLDDAEADSAADQRAWTTEIIRLCEAADAELDAQADAFDELRQLENNAPQALAEVRSAASTAAERATAAEATLATLAGDYSASALKPVSTNVDQAAKLLSFAGTAADNAQAAIGAGKSGDAAIAVRTAQASVGQATQLFDAIDTLAKNLGEARDKLDAAVADTRQDIAAARALPRDSASASLAPAVAAAEAALAAAATSNGDPIASLDQVEQANAALDTVFTGVRDHQAQVAHARAQLDATISAARAQIQGAAEYITTRRGGIGESARTRVSEADRHLSQAVGLAASDPVAALAEAQQANRLGATAFDLAQRDVESFAARETYSSGYRSQGADGADLGGLLGGIIGGLIGAGAGGSWSGGGSRSSWPGGGGSRSSRSGSFGGSSRSSSRGSGGRSSRGGRF